MKSRSTSSTPQPSPEPLAPVDALCALLVVAAIAIGLSNSQATPFAASDVLVVHLLTALPLTVLVVRTALAHWPTARCRSLGVPFLLASVAPLVACSWSPALTRDWTTSHLSGFAIRTAIAVGLVTGAALLVARLVRRIPLEPEMRESWRWTLLLSALLLPVATFTYETARCQSDRNRLPEFLEQSRLRDAQTVAQRMFTLQPTAELRGARILLVTEQINRAIRELESRTSQPLSSGATSAQKIARARELAILGENSAAVDVLASLPELTKSPSACNLLGTISETEHHWSDAAQWYTRARENCLANREADESSAELLRATTGLAYCQRKQGDFAAAEQTYLQLLSLSPTADTNFLLATFYEDTQQVTKAQTYARRAMALAPERYQAGGQRLIDKLITVHFGCLKAFTAADE